MTYLHDLSATATSCPKSLSLASKGLLHTQKTRAKQSDSSLMYPFLDDTLKLGSVYATEY